MRDEDTDGAAHFSVWQPRKLVRCARARLHRAPAGPRGQGSQRPGLQTAFLSERRGMMQEWADYLDWLRVGEELEASRGRLGLQEVAQVDQGPEVDLAFGFGGRDGQTDGQVHLPDIERTIAPMY